VLREALVDLAPLLVRVHVQRKPCCCGVATELLEPVRRAGAHGVGGKPDPNPAAAQLLELAQVRGRRLLPEPRQAAAGVGGEQQRQLDRRLLRRVDGCERLVEPEVVELADRGVAGGAHLGVDARVCRPHRRRRLALRLREHDLSPGPEVPPFGAAAKRSLKGMRMGVDEARQCQGAFLGGSHEGTILG
jgi:hypothetical protein